MILGLQCVVLGVVVHLTRGKLHSLPYASSGSCRNTTTEYVKDNRCCNRCQPGNRVTTICSKDVNTVCEPCQDGTYSDNFNYHPNCFRCNKCSQNKNLVIAKQCTKVSDTVCVCKAGMQCVHSSRTMSCDKCIKVCPPGQGTSPSGTARSNKCAPCPEGTFSKDSSFRPCQPHTRCDLQGRKVLHPGTSEYDAICDRANTSDPRPATLTATPGPLVVDTSITSLLLIRNPRTEALPTSSFIVKFLPTDFPDQTESYWIAGLGAVAAVALLVLLTVTFVIHHRKDLIKPAVEDAVQVSDIHHSHTESQCLLVDSKTEPSTSSSDSHSQAELSRGQSVDSGYPEHGTLPSPCVNLSITATFNCQLKTGANSCSIPIDQPAPPPASELPLSQEEELCSSCQSEESKDAVCLAQETGKTVE
ncbi:hypothetical protein P4O66_006093 [Electrophorus voltai]|uniref:TNFR-Cys domain-containing protein n=1 Tax=Electrophorus voltai TaxID=2609070 RepID=A0AAD8ZHK1_9TELE|nr:hypothetical protein P4O66_006093 [Electrophorus voltai]